MVTTMTPSETGWYLAKVVFAVERSGTLQSRSRPSPGIDQGPTCDERANSSINSRTDLSRPKYRIE
jgi:hypothetical protein